MIDFKIYSVLISKQDYLLNCIYNSIPYSISYLCEVYIRKHCICVYVIIQMQCYKWHSIIYIFNKLNYCLQLYNYIVS